MSHFSPLIIPEQSEAVSVKSPQRVCPCSVRFTPIGKETLCPDCESGAFLGRKRTCRGCDVRFYPEDVFDHYCSFCYDTNHLSD